MTAFEVLLNEQRIAVAGVGPSGVITAIVTWVKRARGRKGRKTDSEDIFLQVGGLIKSMEHVSWAQRDLRVGDEVRVRIVSRPSVDRPHKRHRRKPEQELRSKKQYVRRMAEELGWTIRSR